MFQNKNIQTILAAMMFFAVVIRGPSLPGEIRGWFEVYFEIALFMGLAGIIWSVNKWLSSFLMLVCVFQFFPQYGPQSYLAGKAVFNGCLWYLFIVLFFNVQSLNTLYRVMRIFVYFHVGVASLQILGLAGWLSVPLPTGLMANPLETSALIAFCLPAFLVFTGKPLFLVLIPIAGLMIVKQFLGIAAVGAGMVVYLAIEYRIYWAFLVAIGVAAVWWVVLDAPGIELRVFVWKQALKAWWQHPVFGAGIGHWKVVFLRPMAIDGLRWSTTHNEFLQMLFELGISSAVIFAGYAVSVIRRAAREMAIPVTAIVIVAVYSAASFPMHIAPTAMIAVTWIAILDIYFKQKENVKCQMM